MVWRIVTNSVWRMRSAYAITALAVGLIWMAAGNLGFGTGALLAISMAAAFADGPFLGVVASGPKEFIYLPLSRRQLWTARWMTAVIIPVVLLLTAKLLGLAAASVLRIPGPINIRTAWLSSVYDCAYAGAGLSVILSSGGGYLRPRRVERTLRSWLWLVSVIVFTVGPAWPLIFSAFLATEWSQLSLRGWIVLAGGLGLTVATVIHTPRLAHPGRQDWGATGRSKTSASYGSSAPAIGFARLMWPEIALGVGMVAMMATMFLSIGVDARMEPSEFAILYFLFCMPSPRTMGPEAALRPLRMLPLSTRALAAILAAKPVMMYVAVWIFQEVLRSGFGVPIPRLTVGMTCWLVGVASVVAAASMKWSGHRVLRFVAAVPFVAGIVLSERWHTGFDVPFGWLPLTAVVVGVAAAVVLNFHTLRHSRSVYKPVKLPAMFATQGPSA
jgi:hypothetical protein